MPGCWAWLERRGCVPPANGIYLSRGCRQFKPYPNAFDLTTDHHQVPAEIVSDPLTLKEWGQRALHAAIEAAKAKQLAGIERSREAKRAKKKSKSGD